MNEAIFILYMLIVSISSCNYRNAKKVDVANYNSIAVIVGYTKVPSSLYLIFTISKSEYEQHLRSGNVIDVGRRAVINIHLNQVLINSKLKNYYTKVPLIRSECGMELLDENQRCAFVHVKWRNYNVYSENKRITHDVVMDECTSYVLDHTDSSSISLVPLTQE